MGAIVSFGVPDGTLSLACVCDKHPAGRFGVDQSVRVNR
jgi:hypothetical protein